MPNNIIMADAKGPTDIVTGSATVSADRKITIPLDANKKNFAIFPDYSAEESPSSQGTLVSAIFRLDYLSDTRCYSSKISSWTSSPPTLAIGAIPSTSVVESANSITIQCKNNNTAGLLWAGKPVRYFIW